MQGIFMLKSKRQVKFSYLPGTERAASLGTLWVARRAGANSRHPNDKKIASEFLANEICRGRVPAGRRAPYHVTKT